jgi:hypothetical protein
MLRSLEKSSTTLPSLSSSASSSSHAGYKAMRELIVLGDVTVAGSDIAAVLCAVSLRLAAQAQWRVVLHNEPYLLAIERDEQRCMLVGARSALSDDVVDVIQVRSYYACVL